MFCIQKKATLSLHIDEAFWSFVKIHNFCPITMKLGQSKVIYSWGDNVALLSAWLDEKYEYFQSQILSFTLYILDFFGYIIQTLLPQWKV